MKTEQKEKNQKYILDHLEEYVIDAHGNFVNPFFGIDTQDCDDENNYYCIGRESVSNWDLLSYEISENILKNKQDWELVIFIYDDGSSFPNKLENKKTGATILGTSFSVIDRNWLIGEFGYRENDYKDWDKWKEQTKASREFVKEFANNPNYFEPLKQPEPDQKEAENRKKWLEEERKKVEEEQKQRNQNKNSNPPFENNSPQTPNPEKETNNLNKPEKDNLSPTDIKNHQYNSDKAKSEITSLTDSKEKQKAEELLKVIITAELLSQKKQFNQEILTKLLAEKEQNSSVYQLLI